MTSPTSISANWQWRRLPIACVFGVLLLSVFWTYWRAYRLRGESDLTLALTEISHGNFSRARRQVRENKDMPGAASRHALLQGSMLLKRGHAFLAVEELTRASNDPMLREQALLRLGEAWYGLGRHLEAQESWQTVLETNANHLEAHRWLAASYYDLGAVQHAIQHLQEVGRLDPHDPRPHRLLGLINKDYERYEEAVPYYEESLRRKRNQPAEQEIREELAECLCRLQNHRNALRVLKDCQPTAKVGTLTAECQHALGEVEAARHTLQQVLKEDPSNLDALLLDAAILLEENRSIEAILLLERATAAHPKDFTAQFKLSQAYARVDNEERAKAVGKVAEEIRAIRKEFADLHQVAWNNPHDRQARLRLAELAKELDQPKLAEMWIKSANALLPETTQLPQDLE